MIVSNSTRQKTFTRRFPAIFQAPSHVFRGFSASPASSWENRKLEYPRIVIGYKFKEDNINIIKLYKYFENQ